MSKRQFIAKIVYEVSFRIFLHFASGLREPNVFVFTRVHKFTVFPLFELNIIENFSADSPPKLEVDSTILKPSDEPQNMTISIILKMKSRIMFRLKTVSRLVVIISWNTFEDGIKMV